MAKFRIDTVVAADKKPKTGFDKVVSEAKAAKREIQDLKSLMQLAGVGAGIAIVSAGYRAMVQEIGKAIAASESATAAQGRLDQAVKNLYKTVGDQMTPGLTSLGISLQTAFANPEIQEGLETLGRYLGLVATGIGAVAEEIGELVSTQGFKDFLEFISGADLDSQKLKEYEAFNAGIAELVDQVDKWAKSVKKQAAEEEAAAKKRKTAWEQEQRALAELVDKYDKHGAEIRATEKDLATLIAAVQKQPQRMNEWIATIEAATIKLAALRGETQLAADPSAFEALPIDAVEKRLEQAFTDLPTIRPEEGDIDLSVVDSEFKQINDGFAAQLEAGTTYAFAAAFEEFIRGGDDALEHFGDMMIDILLRSVAEWLAAQLAASAKAAAANAGMSAGGGAGGGGGWTSALGGAAGIAAIAVVAMKAFADSQNAAVDQQYNQGHRYYFGGMQGGSPYSGYRFPDAALEAGNTHDITPLTEAIESFFESFREAIGGTITGIGEVAVKVRNDGKEFEAVFQGEVLGHFATIEEALVAGVQAAFKAGDFEGVIDPIIQQVLANYSGDKTKIFEIIEQVQGIVDATSGLSEIELSLRDLPGQASQLSTQLNELGVSMSDADVLAAKWYATQLQGIRDQITGHEMSEAEQRAQKEREALMFNAQLELDAAKIEAEKLNLQNQIAIETAKNQVMTEGAQASIDILNAQLAAYDQILAIMATIQPIDLKEIKLPKGTGGRFGGGSAGSSGPTGPTPEEQIAALNEELDQLANSLLPQWIARQQEITRQYEDQIARATELGIPLDRINELYQQQLDALAQDALASLGLESVNTANAMQDLADTLAFLESQGAITADQLAELGNQAYISLVDGLLQYVDNEEVRRQLEELRFQMEMANYAIQLQTLRALGLLTEEQLALISSLLGDIYQAHREGELDFQQPRAPRVDRRDSARERRERAAEERRRRQEEERERRERLLTEALDRLRNAFESIQSVRDSFQAGALSPFTLEQQMRNAGADYQSMLARARGGDVEAIEGLADAARLYAELAGQVLDPSSSAYAQLVAALDAQLAGVQGGIQGILDAAPDEMAGTEERLDTIAQILNQIRLLGGGSATWNPFGAGNPTRPPIPVPGGGNSIDARFLGGNGNLLLGNFGTAGRPMVITSPALDAIAREAKKTSQGVAKLGTATDDQTEALVSLSFASPTKGQQGGYVGGKPTKSAMGA